jgi:hypothetical protein
MQEANFLRHLIDFIKERSRAEEAQQPEETGEVQQPEIHIHVGGDGVAEVGSEEESDQPAPVDVESPIDRDDVFIPPLQAKIEMMKKLTGVPPKDETLKQSQEQGGPAPAAPAQTNQNVLARRRAKMQDMVDDDPTGM